MEYVAGRSLTDLADEGKLNEDRIIELAIQICDGLSKAHREGICHRDVKPSNIVVDDDGRPRLLDFGLASITGADQITQVGSTLGTAAFMSPEQVHGEELDERSDLYSLGVTLYELITGRSPFRRDNTAATMQAILKVAPDPLARFRTEVSDDLQRIISKLIEKDPQMRYQSAAGVVSDLKLLRRDLSSGAYPVSGVTRRYRIQRRRRTYYWVGGLASVVLLLVLLNPFGFEIGSSGSAKAAENALAVLGFENLSDPDDQERLGQILQELVITDLSDIASMKLLSSQRLFDVQKQLGYRDRTKIDRDVAGEVARKAGARTMLTGNLMRLNEQWVITCQLVDVAEGTVITSHRIDGGDLYAMVDDLSGRVRSDLTPGEPAGGKGQTDVAVSEKTTGSIEAYRHYLEGVDLLGETEYEEAIGEFEKAVAIDPEFNQAYYKMAIAQWWLEDVASGRGRESIRRLLDEKRYSSPREKNLLEAALLLIEQRYGDAAVIYRQLTEEHPDDKESWYGLGEALYHQSHSTRGDALAAFEHAIELDAGFVLAYRHVFDIYRERQDITRYRETAHQLIEAAPDAPAGYRYLTLASIAVGDSTMVEQTLRQALDRQSSDSQRRTVLVAVAAGYNHFSLFDKAEAYVRRAVPLDPDSSDPDLWYNLGRALNGQGQFVQGKRLYEHCIRLDGNHRGAYDGLLNLADAENDYDEAIKHAWKLCELSPQSGFQWRRLIDLCERAYRSAEADSAFEQAMQTFIATGTKVSFISDVAQVYSRLERRRHRATELIERGKKLDAAGAGLKLLAVEAQVALDARQYERAELLARQIIAVDSEHVADNWARGTLFNSYTYRGKWEQAARALEDQVNDTTNPFSYYTGRLELLVYSGRPDQVDSLLAIALDECSSLSSQFELVNNVGFYYTHIGRYDLAVQQYQRAYEMNPNRIWILDRLGRTHIQLGDFTAAESNLRTALEKDSTRIFTKLYRMQAAYRQDSSTASLLRNFGYMYAYQGKYGLAAEYAERALAKDSSFYSRNLLGWALAAGDIDLDRAVERARFAADHPPANDPFDRWIPDFPFVPLPQHTLGLAFLKKGELSMALEHLEQAARLRPDDERIARELQQCRDRMGS
jgi:tetratricopeptide (TPR) repeat protein